MFDMVCLPRLYLLIFTFLLVVLFCFLIRKKLLKFFQKISILMTNLIESIIKNYRFLISFIIFLYLVSISELYVESSFIYLPNLLKYDISARTIVVLVILLFIFLIPNSLENYQKKLKIQKINRQCSWLMYFHFSLFLSPIISMVVLKTKTIIDFLDGKLIFSILGDTGWLSISVRFVWLFLGIFWYIYTKAPSVFDQVKNWRFAPFCVDTENDKFDWKESAEREATNLLAIDKYISVVLVDGKQGDGKSSYARMIVEALTEKDKLNILYTYISLTETNQEKDFSKMFLERCFATINERYPKINFSNSLPIIREGLRDNGYGIWSVFLDMLTRVNQGISKTKSIVHDPYTKSNNYVDKEVAEKFGNVQVINEDLWIILIDEIDRAPAKEIYRAIETIERYKHDGRCGLPVKIIFMLCVDRLTLYKNLKGIKYD